MQDITILILWSKIKHGIYFTLKSDRNRKTISLNIKRIKLRINIEKKKNKIKIMKINQNNLKKMNNIIYLKKKIIY